MEMTRRIITNVVEPKGTRGPMGTLIKLRSYPDATFNDITAPNADTLYTTAFFDVGDEPWVLDQPDMGDRYFLLPLLSGWTDVFEVPGSPHHRWRGQDLPRHRPRLDRHRSRRHDRTEIAHRDGLAAGRIYCTGTPEDYDAVHKLQDAFKLQPLSTWGSDYTPPAGTVDPSIDMKTPDPRSGQRA